MNHLRKIFRYSFPWARRNLIVYAPRLLRRLKLAFFRQHLSDGILTAGPFVGELGFEIGEWIPHIKSLADRYNCALHVFTRKGHEALYPFAEIVQTYDFPVASSNCNWLFEPSEEEIDRYNKLENNMATYAAQPEFSRKFQILLKSGPKIRDKSFRSKVPVLIKANEDLLTKWKNELPPDPKVVLTYRANTRGSERNSSTEFVNQAANFVIKMGLTPIIIGKIDDKYPVPDFPGINLINKSTLEDVIAIYQISRVVMGSSTGIIHLAASCGIPHITWGSTYKDDAIIERYKKDWNLNGTWVRFVSKEWNIDFKDVESVLLEAIESSGYPEEK